MDKLVSSRIREISKTASQLGKPKADLRPRQALECGLENGQRSVRSIRNDLIRLNSLCQSGPKLPPHCSHFVDSGQDACADVS